MTPLFRVIWRIPGEIFDESKDFHTWVDATDWMFNIVCNLGYSAQIHRIKP